MRLAVVATAVVTFLFNQPVHAAGRSLDVPPDKGWQHADTGVILMPQLGEFRRTALIDNSASELDIAATYSNADNSTYAAIYIYRPGIFHLPMWFDRSRFAMALNPNYKLGAPTGPIQRFAPPGNSAQSGLRLTHTMSGSQSGATALAMAPVGNNWLVAIRLTSHDKSAASVDAILSGLIAAIRWPAQASAAAAPDPVQPCPQPLKFKRAKVVPSDMTQSLLGSLLAITADDVAAKKPTQPLPYCLEGAGTAAYSVYRPVGDNQRYVIAFGDSGVAATVSPQFRLDGKRGNYSVALSDLESVAQYPAFNALPEPAQVFDLVMKSPPTSKTTRGTKDISVSLPKK